MGRLHWSVFVNGLVAVAYLVFAVVLAVMTASPAIGLGVAIFFTVGHINLLKGKEWMVWLFWPWPVAPATAVRIAKPRSWWARHFYGPGSAKEDLAQQRFPGPDGDRLSHWVSKHLPEQGSKE